MHVTKAASVLIWGFVEGGVFQREVLLAHNQYRLLHGTPRMKLDPAMDAQAMLYAKKLMSQKQCPGRLIHSEHQDRPEQGENLALICSNGKYT